MRRKSLSPHQIRPHSTSIKNPLFPTPTQPRPQTRSLTRPNSSIQSPNEYQKSLRTSYMLSKIKKSIKQNNIKYLLGEKPQKLRTEPEDNKQWQTNNIHDNLIDIRRKYDAVKRERVLRMNRTQALKERVRMHTEEEKQWRDRVSKGKDGCKDGEKLIRNNRLELQCKKTDAKVLEHMQQRLKQDIKYYKCQIIIQKRTLNSHQHTIRCLNSKSQQFQTQTQNSNKLLYKLQYHIKNEREEQQQHLQNIQELVRNKHLQEQIQKDRIIYEQQEEEKAFLARNQEERNWYELFVVHTFVKKLLVNKMSIELAKFGLLEDAWRNIKVKTQVKTADLFVQRFMNRERIYGDLLGEVSRSKQRHSQLQLEQLRLTQMNQALEEQKQELLNLQYQLLTEKQKMSQNLSKQLKQKQTLEANSSMEIRKKQFKQWVLRELLKFSKLNKKRYPFQNTYYQFSIPILFTRYLNCLNDQIELKQSQWSLTEPQEEDNSVIAGQTTIQVNLQNKSMMASTNAKTKVDRQKNEMKISKLRSHEYDYIGMYKNESKQYEMGRQRQKDKTQQRQNIYKFEEQEEAIESKREEVLKKNERYMKQLRVKYRQLKNFKL